MNNDEFPNKYMDQISRMAPEELLSFLRHDMRGEVGGAFSAAVLLDDMLDDEDYDHDGMKVTTDLIVTKTDNALQMLEATIAYLSARQHNQNSF